MILDQLMTFLGWSTLLNFALMALATLALWAMPGVITGIHGRMFGLDRQDIVRSTYNFLAIWKVAVIVLNFVPYLVLRLAF